ncbi:hypothetical protein D0Z00_000134 [Geotrichum galactomycetum]|uniref:Uncharacterized protein n=1 Tax=Geotrichum galactomycetum TaxID=27317 RepID=A0ACB6VAX9_9ASCO|nr:hypothetical protein D0Z00_000134 [Geotrichum candidum]
MAFEDEILGPDFTGLDQFIPYNYGALYERVVASEPRAALELEFLTDGRTSADDDYREAAKNSHEEADSEPVIEGDGENDEENGDEEDLSNSEDDGEQDDGEQDDGEQDDELEPESIDDKKETLQPTENNSPEKNHEKAENSSSDDKMEVDVKEPTVGSTTTTAHDKGKQISQRVQFGQASPSEDKSVLNGVPHELELYFATYIWTLIYFRQYYEACTVAERYRDSVLFAISPVLRASTTSALRFHRKTTNDTLDFQGIYRIAGMFPWEDASKGGSFGLAQLVKDALSVFQNDIYGALRDRFTRIRVETVAKYLPISEEHETIHTSDVLRVLNSVENGWTQEGDEILIPPKVVTVSKQSSAASRFDGETRKQWLNELVKVASELEQISVVE